MVTNDLHVTPISDALKGSHIDLVVSGSIGAVESVRFIRAMRRLGAEIYPYITQGAQLFTTPTALAWASTREAIQHFEGIASHLALRDACIVAPASANFISKVAQGITDSPATALVASYLGQRKPVLFVPNMHDSLWDSPFVAANIQRLKSFAQFLNPRTEEGKQKFPDPRVLADNIAHLINNEKNKIKILVTMGTTRGYIDSVRYISNYSSGALGSKISEEFYRQGYSVQVVAGPCSIMPKSFSELIHVETHEEMAAAVEKSNLQKLSGAIFAASVLDFVPDKKVERKIRSTENLEVSFTKTSKIINLVTQTLDFKIGFKLESDLVSNNNDLAQTYINRYGLTLLIMNQLAEVSSSKHKAYAYKSKQNSAIELDDKEHIARFLVENANQTFCNFIDAK